MMLNQISITGNMGRAATLRFTQNGKPVWGFPLAFTPRRKNDEQWEDAGPTQWFDVTVWGDDATDLAERYGDTTGQATVVGRLGTREYEGSTQLTITADAVTIRPKRQQQGQQGGPHQQADPWQQPQQQWGGQQPADSEPAPF